MHRTSARRPRSRRRAAGLVVAATLALTATACITSAEVAGGVLTIVGSEYADVITLRLQAGNPNVLEVDDSADPAVEHTFDRSTFAQIVVEGGEEADTLVVDESNGVFTDTEVTTLVGAAGDDTLLGGSASELLYGGTGEDTIDGAGANDLMSGGDGADLLRWGPGDGGGQHLGGAGIDRFEVEVTDGDDIIEVERLGGGLRIWPVIGGTTVAVSADDVEVLDLDVLEGTDVVEVGDLRGTDVTEVVVDLAGSSGVDTAVDEVRVPPGVSIGREGADAVVTGLGGAVRLRGGGPNDRVRVVGTPGDDFLDLRGSDATDAVTVQRSVDDVIVRGLTPVVFVVAAGVEDLAVDLAAGDDTFSTSGNLAALTTFDITGGAGADTISGSNGMDAIDRGSGPDEIFGAGERDTISGGDGDDTVLWSPASGNDWVRGDVGWDRVVMSGNTTGEQFSVQALADGTARLTRDIGAVTLDVAQFDAVEVLPGDGPDTVTVHDLQGSGIVQVDVDLDQPGGSTFAMFDQVHVRGTDAVDHVGVDAVGAAVEVDGLAARVRVTRPDANDELVVTGLGGADFLIASLAATALMQVTLVQ
jgi:Ca2+-binding RTX toxin-like protein